MVGKIHPQFWEMFHHSSIFAYFVVPTWSINGNDPQTSDSNAFLWLSEFVEDAYVYLQGLGNHNKIIGGRHCTIELE